MNRTAVVVGGVLVAGVGGYLAYAYAKCKFPFENVGKCREEAGPEVPSPPGQPSVQVNVIDQNTAEADVSWGAVPGATYYKVFVDGQEVVGNVSGTTARLTSLVPGRTYSISVAACN